MTVRKKAKGKCYLYTRVSTEMQVDGYSLEAQEDHLRKAADLHDLKVIKVFSDEGKSGKNVTGRPEYQEMMRRIQNDNEDGVDYVLVYKLSRFGRNAADVLANLQIMQDYGVNLYSVEESIDSAGAAGKLMISVIAAVAEIERENIRVQTMAGREQKARDGRWNGGQAPYGYAIKDGALVINDTEAELIRLIYDKFLNTNLGLNGVAKWLNDNNIRKRTRQNGKYTRISARFVKGVIDNPVYKGMIAYGRQRTEKIAGTRNEFHMMKQADYGLYDGQHEPIIDPDVWQAAQTKRAENAFKRERVHSLEHAHIVSGLLKCPVCGASMYGVVNRKRRPDGTYYADMWYYVCKNRKIVGGEPCGYKTHLRQDIINHQVRAVVQEALRNMDFTDEVLKTIGADGDTDRLREDLKGLESDRRKESLKKTKLLQKLSELDPDDECYDAMYDDLQGVLREHTQSIAALDARIAQVSAAISTAESQAVTAEQVYKVIDALWDRIDQIPDMEQKGVMQALIDSVQIYEKRQPNGLWVKSVRFKIPVNIGGVWSDNVVLDVDGGDSLPLGNNDETVVLMSRVKD